MNDLTARMLTARRLCGDRVILDWLELTRMIVPLDFGVRGWGVHIDWVLKAWGCSKPMASRRLAAINAAPPEAGLGRVERAHGSWWVVAGAGKPAMTTDTPSVMTPTLPDLFRAWWKESYPTTPPNPRTVDSHVAFAEFVLGQQQDATDEPS